MIPAMIFLLLLSLLGLVGNSLVLFVYSRKLRASPTTVFIRVMAAFDLLTNIVAIPGEIYDMFHIWDFDNPTLCRFRFYVTTLPTLSSAMLLLAVAVVRYRKVCRPYGWQVTLTQAKFTCLMIFILGLLFSVPHVIFNGRQTKDTSRPGIHGYECTTDDAYVDTAWPLINNGFFLLLFFACCIPFVTLYVLIGVQAWRHSKIYGASQSSLATAKSAVSNCSTDAQSEHQIGISTLKPPRILAVKKRKSIESISFGNMADVIETSDQGVRLSDNADEYDVRILEDSIEVSTPVIGQSTVLFDRILGPDTDHDLRDDNPQTIHQKNSTTTTSAPQNVTENEISNLETQGFENLERDSGQQFDTEEEVQKETQSPANNRAINLKPASDSDDHSDSGIETDQKAKVDNYINGNTITSESGITVETVPEVVMESQGLSPPLRLKRRSRVSSSSVVSPEPMSSPAPEVESQQTGSTGSDVKAGNDAECENSARITTSDENGQPVTTTDTNAKRAENSLQNSPFMFPKSRISQKSDRRVQLVTTLKMETYEGTPGAKNVPEIAGESGCDENDDNEFNPVSSKVTGKKDSIPQTPRGSQRLMETVRRMASNFSLRKRADSTRGSIMRKPIGRTTAMLIIISAIFFAGFVPYLALSFFRFTSPDKYDAMNMVERSFYNLFLRFFFLNSGANPIVYSFCDVSFRRECLRLFKCRR